MTSSISLKIDSHVRGGGKVGGSLKVAKVVGKCSTYGLERQFIRGTFSGSSSGKSGVKTIEITAPGIYEVRGQMTEDRSISKGDLPTYFIQVCESGEVSQLVSDDITAAIESRNWSALYSALYAAAPVMEVA